jgi:hypothetical protein
MFKWFRGGGRPGSGPDFSAIDSKAKAEVLFERGELQKCRASCQAGQNDPASYPHTSGVYNLMMSGGEYGSQKSRGTEPSVHE